VFKINDLYTKNNTSIVVTNGDSQIEFIINSVLSMRNKEELDSELQFKLLNEYLEYKGQEFKNELYNKLLVADEEITLCISKQDIYPLPTNIIHPILDQFDMMDVFNYIKYIYKLQPPSNLAEVFDQQLENDGRVTRVQTYLKDDYLELAALALIMKATLGPLCQYAYVKNKDINSLHKEYILFHFYKTHKIYNTPPMAKLYGLVDKLVNLPSATDDTSNSIRILEKQISSDDIVLYMLSIVVVQKLMISTLVDDNEIKNVITRIYVYISNKLKATGDVSKSIRDKTILSDVDGSHGDQESHVESFRVLAELSTGQNVELCWSVRNVDVILKELPDSILAVIDKNDIFEAMQFTKIFNNGNIHQIQINILAILFKSIIDPRAMPYLNLDNIISMLTVGFAYLNGIGHHRLALLLTAQPSIVSLDTISINSSVNRTRIPKEIKDELDRLFPYGRVVNSTTTANLAEETVNDMANEMFNIRWIPTAYDNYIINVLGNKDYNKLLSSDLKILLADMVIKNEIHSYGR